MNLNSRDIHSIIFGDKNSWVDWYLIPSSRPVFNPPAPKYKFVDVPGSDGHLDLSTALTGEITYSPREGSIEFIVDNDHVEWYDLYSDIMAYLHGQYIKAVLEDDPAWYYEGRFSVNEWKSESQNSKIVIDYTVSPYKIESTGSLDDWIWDTFNFNNGIIREYKNLKVDGTLDFIVYGRRMSVSPTFIVDSTDNKGMTVTFNGTTYNLPEGTSRVVNIRTVEGENKFKFRGHGTISIDYRGGCL